MSTIQLYVDGACKGNPGPGGCAVAVFKDGKFAYGGYAHTEEQTTNNREELKAMIAAIHFANMESIMDNCIIYCDSAYVVNTVKDWIWSWAKNDWKNSKKKTIENIDLIKTLYNHINTNFFKHQVEKVTGHGGIVGNEFVDALATGNLYRANTIAANNPQIFDNFENLWDNIYELKNIEGENQ